MRTMLLTLTALVGATTAHATTVSIDPETCFDLDAGAEADDFGFGCTDEGDIRWAYNATPPAFQPLFWNGQFTDVGYVPKPYDDVTTLDIPGTTFCDYLGAPTPECEASVHDQRWDPSRTALVRTDTGAIFRVRWLAFDSTTFQVSFEYSSVPEGELASVFRFTQQGRLLDASGAPLQGDRSLQIALHDSPEDGETVWSKLFTNTSFSDGFFSVTLSGPDDSDRPLDSVAVPELYMSFAVDGVSIGDRQRVSMVPAAARAHGAAIIDATAPCGVVGGLGYDTTSQDLHVCTGSSWQRIGLSAQDQPSCPEGMVALGAGCIDQSVRTTVHWDDALSDCMGSGRRLCSADEMTYACKERGNLGLSMPDSEWMWLAGRTIDTWTNNQWAETYHVFRRVGTGCTTRVNSYQNSGHNVSWEWGSTQRRYYCCADPR